MELDLKDSYYNMKEKIEPVMFIVDIAKEAMEELGIKPRLVPVRVVLMEQDYLLMDYLVQIYLLVD